MSNQTQAGKIENSKLKDKKTLPRRKAGWKFWIIFWVISGILLFGWYVFLQVKNKNIENLKAFVNFLPIGAERRNELNVIADIYQKAGGFDREQTFMILFQNNMELRPGGGFIGTFGILKTKGGKVSDIQVHDTGNFDGRIPDTETPPAPMQKYLNVSAWKLRDSNWSPDFKTNAEKAEYFYKLGQGGENFDGVIAINTDVLNSLLAITGPVKINGYPGEYNDETAILQLEYQVEKGYAEQGIQKGERKNILNELAVILAEKAKSFSNSQRIELAKKIEQHLKQKDIQMFFKDESLQAEVQNMAWNGEVKNYDGDYLMAVDANLNSLKSDICIRRSMDYFVDLSGETPTARLTLSYEHTCRTADWMTANYQDWLRVYVPEGSFITAASGQTGDVQYSEELGKKALGMLVYVPVGDQKSVTLSYGLPQDFKLKSYNLLIQKQSGSGEVLVNITLKKPDGSEEKKTERISQDSVFNF